MNWFTVLIFFSFFLTYIYSPGGLSISLNRKGHFPPFEWEGLGNNFLCPTPLHFCAEVFPVVEYRWLWTSFACICKDCTCCVFVVVCGSFCCHFLVLFVCLPRLCSSTPTALANRNLLDSFSLCLSLLVSITLRKDQNLPSEYSSIFIYFLFFYMSFYSYILTIFECLE